MAGVLAADNIIGANDDTPRQDRSQQWRRPTRAPASQCL